MKTLEQAVQEKRLATAKLVQKFNSLYKRSLVYLEQREDTVDVKLSIDSSLLNLESYKYASTNDHFREVILALAGSYDVSYNNTGSTFWLSFGASKGDTK